ncbi:hypothetical protein EYZ11_006981 [Aspergillus tanneri]|uniref:DUF6314 domain-containing protein n=1 Tax=Aspergillus tanneri TaxID=1220188 RepID=A0A4V3UP33_9EURO|nr:uncharacterized protein ATNIH1004_010456 [Aspergillus tanneri]KAA8643682.1 hypothetical protein ATNIH1004_010456 [Aspergillus tanneri]THC93554.1 hypothetical protein EYZ11_006981 [Aspergillus tanneri]
MPDHHQEQLIMCPLAQIFASLCRTPQRWTLHRILKSANTQDIQGNLHGTATFTPLRTQTSNAHSKRHPDPEPDPDVDRSADMVYREEGTMPSTVGVGVGVGLRFTKKYIWRMSDTGGISVWFAKVQGTKIQDDEEPEPEPDYLFHEFVLDEPSSSSSREKWKDNEKEPLIVEAPIPPRENSNNDRLSTSSSTTVVRARGNHLCINDMYHTAYAFRIRRESGEVVSWSSRHVVKGPKKDQDIVNLYWLGE